MHPQKNDYNCNIITLLKCKVLWLASFCVHRHDLVIWVLSSVLTHTAQVQKGFYQKPGLEYQSLPIIIWFFSKYDWKKGLKMLQNEMHAACKKHFCFCCPFIHLFSSLHQVYPIFYGVIFCLFHEISCLKLWLLIHDLWPLM